MSSITSYSSFSGETFINSKTAWRCKFIRTMSNDACLNMSSSGSRIRTRCLLSRVSASGVRSCVSPRLGLQGQMSLLRVAKNRRKKMASSTSQGPLLARKSEFSFPQELGQWDIAFVMSITGRRRRRTKRCGLCLQKFPDRSSFFGETFQSQDVAVVRAERSHLQSLN